MPIKALIASIVKVEAWWRQYLYQLKCLYLKLIDLFIISGGVEAVEVFLRYYRESI
jgi:hypothetical protein